MNLRQSFVNKAVFINVLIIALMVSYLPLRSLFLGTTGLDLWPHVTIILQISYFISALVISKHSLNKQFPKLILIYIFYGLFIGLMGLINYGFIETVKGIRTFILPSAAFFWGLSITEYNDVKSIIFLMACLFVFACLFYVADLYSFILNGEAISFNWMANLEDYEWTKFRPDRLGGWVGGLFAYPHPHGMIAACGVILWISYIYHSAKKFFIGALLCVAVCFMPLILGASKTSLLLVLFLVGLSLLKGSKVKFIFLSIIPVGFFMLMAYMSNESVHILHLIESLKIFSYEAFLEKVGVWVVPTLNEFFLHFGRYWYLWIFGSGFLADMGAENVDYIWFNNDIWLLSLTSQIGFVGLFILLSPPLLLLFYFCRNILRQKAFENQYYGFFLIVIFLICVSLHSSTINFLGISYIYFFSLGMAVHFVKIKKKPRTSQPNCSESVLIHRVLPAP